MERIRKMKEEEDKGKETEATHSSISGKRGDEGGKEEEEEEDGERRSNLQFIHIGGKMFHAAAVIHLSSLIKEKKTLSILLVFPPSF